MQFYTIYVLLVYKFFSCLQLFFKFLDVMVKKYFDLYFIFLFLEYLGFFDLEFKVYLNLFYFKVSGNLLSVIVVLSFFQDVQRIIRKGVICFSSLLMQVKFVRFGDRCQRIYISLEKSIFGFKVLKNQFIFLINILEIFLECNFFQRFSNIGIYG